jgi:hypothetical protein
LTSLTFTSGTEAAPKSLREVDPLESDRRRRPRRRRPGVEEAVLTGGSPDDYVLLESLEEIER